MIEKIIEDLLEWCKKNHIKVNQIKDRLFEFPAFGRGFLLIPEEGVIVDSEVMFPMEDEFFENVQQALKEKMFDYFIFQFGTLFYYCKPEIKKNSFNEERYNVDFQDLKYVGENTLELDIALNSLGVHTQYELLNGSGLKNHIKKAKFFKCTTVGLCDKNTLAGTLSWQTECEKLGMKSVLGESIDVALNYDSKKNEIPVTYELKLYVVNYEGWQNLLQINKWINVDCPKFIPEEELVKYANGLICVCGFNTDLNLENKKEVVKWLVKMKGFDKILFQVDTSEWWDSGKDFKSLRYLNTYLKDYIKLIPPVLINDIYYCDPEDYIIKDYLNKIGKKATDYSQDQYLKSLQEVSDSLSKFFEEEDRFYELLEMGLNNLNWMCRKCGEFKIQTGEHKLPKYEFIPEGITVRDFFYNLLLKGFDKKVKELEKDEEVYLKQMNYEFEIIAGAGFLEYFLILWDIIQFAKKNDIMVGPGRGSVGGSTLAYVLDITDIDPIEHNLSFERFLNPARISGERAKSSDSLPDIDVDFMSEYRDIIKEYISMRFGELYTCSIGTFTNFQPKGSIKQGSNVKGLKFAYVNAITKYIPNKPTEYTFRDMIMYASENKELKKFFQDHPEIIHFSKSVIDQPAAASVHASAVLILPREDKQGNQMNIFNWLPIRLMDGKYVSEWQGSDTDKFGLLKEDVLGLNQLDKFKKILDLIKENHNVEIDLTKINFKDRRTYKIFQEGYNEDVFQFNSGGLKSYSKKVKPDCFEDLIAMAALYRPGPMDSNAHLDFALMKHGKKKPEFDYGLKEVTKHTQGLYIYQEQMMSALVVLGKFSPVDSDIARTQIKKFDSIGMRKSEDKFIQGAIENNCPPKEAAKIWKKLVAFGLYAFNRSHSAAYAMIAFQTQWLKANYPLEFWVTAISFAAEEDIPNMLSEIDKLKQGIKVKPPSINNSTLEFTCDSETNNIYWSLTKIKGLGIKTVQPIIDERDKNGRFLNYQDFIARVPKAKVNKAHIEKLILAGAFDEMSGVHQVTDRIEVIKEHCKTKAYPLPEQYKSSDINKTWYWIKQQKVLTGLGTVDYKQLISKLPKGDKLVKLYKSPEQFFECSDYTVVMIAGEIQELVQKKTKKGDPFVILKFLSNNEAITMLVWSDFLEENADFLENCLNKTICAIGKVRFDNYHSQNALQACDETKFYYL